MSLDRFREIAQEKTAHLVMTPELRDRILAQLKKPQPRRHRVAWVTAAACLVVMALSAGILALGSQGLLGGASDDLIAAAQPAFKSPVDFSATKTISVELTGAQRIGPKQDENGLWGYADDTGAWVVEPEYALAHPVEGLFGTVVTAQGEEIQLQLIQFEPKQNADGLWGYVDGEDAWVVEPVYAQADPVEGMCGRVVTVDGEVNLIMLPQ